MEDKETDRFLRKRLRERQMDTQRERETERYEETETDR